MSGPIYPMSIPVLRQFLTTSMDGAGVEVKHVVLSIFEYLKDAERWQHVAENTVQWNNFEPRAAADFRKWIDQEIENERERLVRAGEGRQDGVPGGGGAGDAAHPVI